MVAITPLEVFQRTAKTNCGECGHPSCLAFGAAVAKTGENPGRCPYMDMTGVEVPAGEAKKGEDLGRARDLEFVENLKGKIAALDFFSMAESLGAAWSAAEPDVLVFLYLGQEVRLAKTGITMDGVEPEDPRDQILLYNYVHMGGGRVAEDNWVGLESLPNTISKVRTLATYCEAPLARLFSGMDAETVRELCEQVGARPGPGVSALVEMIVPVLPALPLYVLFWEAEPEDGFEARVKILFNAQVLDILDVESLVFSAERLAERLASPLKNSVV